ncbi:glycosyltransferase family 4 protein [Haliangium sp.]|uniref:glycosyltransferase family 4 protein n=1 Tax=Haliangium sp. TaxID=2663208 RepID=UPI003D1061A9
MTRVLLVQPDAGGRISGGYLYNRQMAEHGAWELLDVAPDDLAARLDGVDHEVVLADSIWLREPTAAPFLALARRGTRVGVMMHSFPSMIATAESGAGVRAEPTAFELTTLEALGTVVVPGRHYADMLAGRAVRVLTASPGIDDAWRAPPRRRTGTRCELVSVGAVTPRKGFMDVVEVLARRPRHDDYRWTIVGSLDVDSDYARAVNEQAHALGSVVLAGQRPPAVTRALVHGADVLVMPSYDENQPLVLLEAIAASVPSVAYAAGAAVHMLDHGRAGLVGPIGDKDALAAHLERLIGDEAERYRMAQTCWEMQQTLPSWATAAQQARALLASA